MLRPFFSATLLLLSALSARAGRPLTLEEAYTLSLRHSDALASRGAGADEVRARVDELAAAVRPKVSLRASEQFLEESSSGRSDNTRRDRPEAKISLEQPLFSGFRETAALKAARAASSAAEADVRRAEHLLYVDVARAFFGLAFVRADAAARDAVLALTRDRLKEVRERERLGRSRRSEAISIDSLAADLEARRADKAREERDAQRLLRFLTGLDEDVDPVVSGETVLPFSREEVSAKAAARPDVLARARAVEAAEHSLSATRREAWPVLDMDGNYYLKRTGANEKINWDVLFSADLPLYRGGAWKARRAQATSRAQSARRLLEDARRRAVLEGESAHDSLSTTLSVLPVLEKFRSLAEANAKAQSQDYRLGLVTNLDVLNALENLQEARLRFEAARLDARIAAAELAAATGSLP